jgi:hypothetical protein
MENFLNWWLNMPSIPIVGHVLEDGKHTKDERETEQRIGHNEGGE